MLVKVEVANDFRVLRLDDWVSHFPDAHWSAIDEAFNSEALVLTVHEWTITVI